MKSRLRPADVIALGFRGLGSRLARTVLTAVGIAIGIAAIVAVVGISASGRADLLATLDELGTNLLRVNPGGGVFGEGADVPVAAEGMVARVGPVDEVGAVTRADATVRRNDLVDELETNGIAVLAAQPEVLEVIGGSVASGRFLDAATARGPAVVLGSVAALRLGITDLQPVPRVYLDGHWFTVIGILDDLPVHPDLERAAFIGYPAATRLFDASESPSTLYVRTDPAFIDAVADVLPATVNPEQPDTVEVSRPSDALEARNAADEALTGLLVGLGAVALLVAGVAIANIMVMSVLERRMEIGVRRALGATRGHIRLQFLVESMLLAGIGGIGGIIIGSGITIAYAANRDLTLAIPPEGAAMAIGAALAIGAVAGLYPAIRASRVPPAEAVRR